MLNVVRKQHGVTLVELLIGMLLGLLVAGAGMGLFLTSLQGQTDNIRLSRLNQDMRALMDIMVRDIRRAGFVTNRPDLYLASLKSNPFFSSTTDLKIYSTGSLTNNCIVYTYNRNFEDSSTTPPTPITPAVDSNEYFGFRLNASGELEMRYSGTTNASCANGDWQMVIEPEVEITALTFTLTTTRRNITSMKTDTDGDGCLDGDDAAPTSASSSCKTTTCTAGNPCYGNKRCDTGEGCNTCITGQACLEIRDVVISMTGRLRDDVSVSQRIEQRVRIRNDRYIVSF
jgi:prepilin peptidase dependent protein B